MGGWAAQPPRKESHRDERFLSDLPRAVGGCLIDRVPIRTGFGDGLRLLGVPLLAAAREHLERGDHDLSFPMPHTPRLSFSQREVHAAVLPQGTHSIVSGS
jgi:hypothetical protein